MALLKRKKPAKAEPTAAELDPRVVNDKNAQPPAVQPVKISATGFDFIKAAKAANLEPIQPEDGEDLADAFERLMAPVTKPLKDGFKRLKEESRTIMPDWARYPAEVLKKARAGGLPKELELEGVVDMATAQGWIKTRKHRAHSARQAIITKELEPAIIPLLEARIAAATELHAQARKAESDFLGRFGIADTPESPVSAATKAILADSEFFLSSFHEWRGDPRKDIWSTLSNKLLAKVR